VSELDRSRWHCRRGLLELDLVLSRFVERHLTELPPDQLAAFKALLELSDSVLWDLVLGRVEAERGAAATIVRLLQEG
jgi:succinate dehydrogenase flavin-adding protein (antitoxin of CptAB toxin-antitoxin module)